MKRLTPLLFALAAVTSAGAATTINAVNHFSYGANIGWMEWRGNVTAGAVIGEYIGSNEGLGYFILYASQTYDAPALFSGIIILVAIVFVANFCLNLLERYAIRWRKAGGQTVQL